MFITQLEQKADINMIELEFQSILSNSGWGIANQIGLKHRENSNDPWFDSIGSLYDRQNNIRIADESDFTVWSLDSSSYIRQQIEYLEDKCNFKCGRVRFMRLLPHHGLSVHRDDEFRYHLVLRTNPYSYISNNTFGTSSDKQSLAPAAVCYHLPKDSHWYKIDTRKVHWVYNGGRQERIHLVVCGDK